MSIQSINHDLVWSIGNAIGGIYYIIWKLFNLDSFSHKLSLSSLFLGLIFSAVYRIIYPFFVLMRIFNYHECLRPELENYFTAWLLNFRWIKTDSDTIMKDIFFIVLYIQFSTKKSETEDPDQETGIYSIFFYSPIHDNI